MEKKRNNASSLNCKGNKTTVGKNKTNNENKKEDSNDKIKDN